MKTDKSSTFHVAVLIFTLFSPPICVLLLCAVEKRKENIHTAAAIAEHCVKKEEKKHKEGKGKKSEAKNTKPGSSNMADCVSERKYFSPRTQKFILT